MATLRELLAQLRVDLDDRVAPYLWTDELLVQFINRALDEACMRAKFVRDADSESTRVNLIANRSTYDFDCKVLAIRRASTDTCPALEITNAETLDYKCPNWEREKGSPKWIIFNLDQQWFRVSPTPTKPMVLNLSVWRRPCKLSIEQLERCPEIPEIHHYNLLDWAKHLAYSIHDAEAHDPEAATMAYRMFETHFGRKLSAKEMEFFRHDRRLKTRPRFI